MTTTATAMRMIDRFTDIIDIHGYFKVTYGQKDITCSDLAGIQMGHVQRLNMMVPDLEEHQ